MSLLEDLMNKTVAQVSEQVNSIAYYYPNKIVVYEPNVPIKKMLPGWEKSKESKIVNLESIYKHKYEEERETLLERSVRRSKKAIIDILLCNNFQLFFTITIADDSRKKYEDAVKKITTWLKNQRDRNGKFKYLIVFEEHKDGAFHFHGVLGDYTGTLKRSRSSKTGRYLTSHNKPVYEFKEYKSGFTKVQYIGDAPEDINKIANYIQKYITKEMVNVFGKRRYLSSRGLNKPIQELNPYWFNNIKANAEFKQYDYGKFYVISDLNNPELPTYTKLLNWVND